MRVKVCGVTRPDDGLAAAELGAWAVGMIFVPGTPRCVDPETARRIADLLPKSVLRVGVFMDQSVADIRRIEREVGLDLIQLHGGESAVFCRTLGSERCLRAVFLNGEDGLERAKAHEAAYLLVDRLRSGQGGAPAGPVDWDMAGRLAAARPRTLLAGGLDPRNVGDAIRRVRPWGVDVSSGVERAPRIKDGKALKDFFEAVEKAGPV